MVRRFLLGISGALAALGALALPASAKPIRMPTLTAEIQHQLQVLRPHLQGQSSGSSVQPPAPPCPENGLLPSPTFGNCGLPELPPTTLPWPGNMAYWGGTVQLVPRVYIVYWGWGEKGAFPASDRCRRETITEGRIRVRLRCDPDGAGRRMASWVYQMGGTEWAGTSSQYYEIGPNGRKRYITNPRQLLAGIWVDDSNPASILAKTNANNKPGKTNTYTDLALEAQRAMKHFRVRDLADANFVIAQPQEFSDPNAYSQGYCAFHDYTQPKLENGIYDGLKPGIAYTNMPYVLAINAAGSPPQNLCGENAVNRGTAGKLDGVSIVLGHEIEETITDPGAEDIQGSGLKTTNLGAWYDTIDADENGDKCAWVGEPFALGLPSQPGALPVPGAVHNIRGNHGTTFAVQTLWSNQANGGLGYCAG